MSRAETSDGNGNGTWTKALDKKMQGVVWSCVPRRLFDDALQVARMAVLGTEPGHPDAYYVRRGAWAAQDYARHERCRKVKPFSTESGGAMPLDEPVGGDDGDLLHETIEAKDSEPAVDSDTLRTSLRDLLGTITSSQERRVLELRFGLRDSGKKYSLKDVGIVCGLSAEAVKKVQAGALKKLQAHLESHDVEDAFDLLDFQANSGPGD